MNSMNYREIFCILQFQEEKWHMAFSFSYIKQTLFLHIGNDMLHRLSLKRIFPLLRHRLSSLFSVFVSLLYQTFRENGEETLNKSGNIC